MRFRPHESPPPMFSRREQFRIMLLIGMLGVIFVAMQFASRPQSWYWLIPPAGRQSNGASAPGVNTKMDDVTVHIKPRTAAASQAANPPASGPAGAPIDAGLLAAVRDDTVGIRANEADTYFEMLAAASETPPVQLEHESRRGVTYTQLMAESDRYRGTLVTIEGEVRRLEPISAGTNDRGFDRLYEAWLFNRDSGAYPFRVVCSEIPEGIPLGSRVSARVRVTGYFFKRYGYQSQGGLQTAPLVLAGSLRWYPAPVQGRGNIPPTPYLAVFLAVVVTAFGLTVWRLRAGDKRFARKRKGHVAEPSADAFRALSDVETVDVAHAFDGLPLDDQPTDAVPPASPEANSTEGSPQA